MPLYSDSNYYYTGGGGTSPLYSPYYTSGLLYGNLSSTSGSAYAPYSSTYNRPMTGTYLLPISTTPRSPTYTTSHGISSRYQPKLSTITESSPLIGSARHTSSLIPLTRIQSPKYSSYTSPTSATSSSSVLPKYIPPRPIAINTADIDVSANRYAHHQHADAKESVAETTKINSPTSSTKQSESTTMPPSNETESVRQARCTIKRDRAVVRLSIMRSRSKEGNKSEVRSEKSQTPEPQSKIFKDLPQTAATTEEQLTWRQRLADDLAAIPAYPQKKSPGELIRERYLIQEANKADAADNVAAKLRAERALAAASQKAATIPNDTLGEPLPVIDKVLVELDPVSHTIRRLSIPQCPSFHDICEDISSDKLDDDLNAGELRRRASLIQEQEQELLEQLQKSPPEALQLMIEPTEQQDNNSSDEKKSIEEHHEVHKVFKLPKKKRESIKIKTKPTTTASTVAKKPKDVELPHGFMHAVKPKLTKASPKANKVSETKKPSFVSTAEIFTFDAQSLQQQQNKTELPETPKTPITAIPTKHLEKVENAQSENQLKSNVSSTATKTTQLKKETIKNATRSEEILKKEPTTFEKSIINERSTKQVSKVSTTGAALKLDIKSNTSKLEANAKTPTFNAETVIASEVKDEPKVATPKPIRKALQKSESGEDFWSKIGTRETLYMTNRKKTLEDTILKETHTEESNKQFAEQQQTGTTTEKLLTSMSKNFIEKVELHAPKIKPEITQVNIKTQQQTAKLSTVTMAATVPKIANDGQKAKSPEHEANKLLDKDKSNKTLINNAAKNATTAKKLSEIAITLTTTTTTKTTTTSATTCSKTTNAKSTETVVNKLQAEANVVASNAQQLSEIKQKSVNALPKSPAAIDKKVSTPQQKTLATVAAPTINADQFITAAPVKAKTSPTTTAAAATQQKTSLLTLLATKSAAKTNTATATATNALTTTRAVADTTATSSSNNLSKFATISNLAQCLQDVDAELADYFPSSAENSELSDNDNDSSFDYSSENGCENLSASMKKKLKLRRKKEKQAAAAAEKARFDPQKKVKIEIGGNKCFVKDEAPRYPMVATPRPLWKREKIVYNAPESSDSDDSDSADSEDESEETDDSTECSSDDEALGATSAVNNNSATASSNDGKDTNAAIIRMSTCSNDSGFEGGTAPASPKKMLETSYTYSQFQKSGRFTAPATVIPRFKNYCVDDFHFLTVLGKGSFGKVLLAELRDTTYYYAVKCLKKDVVLEDDDVDSTLIERKVLALGTKHPYLCHLFCTFQTESHLFFVMEYLNGGDLMFHIQESGRFPEERARFYGAEIISGLKFLHKKGIIYRDLKLDNVLLDYEGHVRIADFGMCKLQIYLDKTADSFCGTPDYMAPEIIKGEKYNQNVDWWSFGVLLYEMLIGQSPFSGCDEDELFWSICNEIPWFPVYISGEATSILKGLLEKDYTKRIGSHYSTAGDIADHIFFRPIDWNLLEKRQLEPPYKPAVKHPLDTQYFDRVFTRERVRLTPIDKDILQSMDQKQFVGFTYTNPHITLD